MRLHIKNLTVSTYLGVFDWEQESKRAVLLQVTLDFDEGRAAASDRIEDTLDYAALEQKIIAAVEARRYGLLEALVAHVAALALEDARVREVTVEAEKPGALRQAECVSIIHTARRT